MKKYLAVIILLASLCSCENKPVAGTSNVRWQIDSLNTIIASKDLELAKKSISLDSLKSIITIKEMECAVHEKKLKQYQQLVEDYHDVVYAIVGEDGLYNYEIVDPD